MDYINENTTINEDTRLAFANEVLNPLAPYGHLDALKEMARRIGMTYTGANGLTVMEAVHAAQMAIATQANPFNGELYYWVQIKSGERILTLHWGRAYWVRLADEYAEEHGTTFRYEFEKILKAEDKQRLDAGDKDTVYRCYVRDTAKMSEYITELERLNKLGYDKDESEKMLGKPPILDGIGIVSKQEKDGSLKYSAATYPHDERCMKRALTNALKKVVTFSTPAVGGSDFDGYVKPDWNPKKGSDNVVDALFTVPDEEEQTTTIDSEEIPEEFQDLAKEWVAMQAEGEATHYDQEQLAERRKVKYWPTIVMEKVEEKQLAENPFRASAVLAYSPFVFPGKKKNISDGRLGQMLEWLGWNNKVKEQIIEQYDVVPTMQERADYASHLTFGSMPNIESVLADFKSKMEGEQLDDQNQDKEQPTDG